MKQKARLTFRKPLSETRAYLRTHKLINKVVRAFWLAYGGDYDDMVGDAYLKMILLYRGDAYDPKRKVSFESFVTYHVRKMLMEQMRTRLGRLNRLPRTEMRDDIISYEDPPCRIDLQSADVDVKVVCRAALNSTRLTRNGKPSRNTIMEVLEGKLAWRPARIRRTVRVLNDIFS